MTEFKKTVNNPTYNRCVLFVAWNLALLYSENMAQLLKDNKTLPVDNHGKPRLTMV